MPNPILSLGLIKRCYSRLARTCQGSVRVKRPTPLLPKGSAVNRILKDHTCRSGIGIGLVLGQIVALALIAMPLHADDAGDALEEWKIKREPAFEFTQKPLVTRRGDAITISFEAKGYCDVTVVIEDRSGNIIRHLGSGVLGKNAPAPFARNTLKQKLVWDCKDDQGKYCDALEACTVRVSLGLKPMYEKDLYKSHYKRISFTGPLFSAAAEGVYVFEGRGLDNLRLF